MISISADTYIRRVEKKVLSHQGFDSWTVLVQVEGNAQYAINPVASTIWEMADGQHTLGDIAATLRRAYEDTPDTLLQDVIEWATGMTTQGLLDAGPIPLI